MAPTRKPTKTSADPLADLREEWGAGDEPPETPAPETPAAPARKLTDPERHDEDVSVVVAAWHADPTSQGFVHRGGGCGCRYLAGVALNASHPRALADEAEVKGDDDAAS